MIRILFLLFIFQYSFPKIYNPKDYFKNLTSKERKKIIVDKGTERPYTGKYNNHYKKGTYVCKELAPTHSFLNQIQSLIQNVDGHLLTKK